MNCKNCKRQGCSFAGKSHEMSYECRLYVGKTNADRIRSMMDEDLAGWLDYISDTYYLPDGTENWLDWLRQEAE